MQYQAHNAFIAPARATAGLWYLALGLCLVIAVYVLWGAATFLTLVLTSGFEGAQEWLGRMMGAESSPTATLVLLSTFIGMGLGPILAVWILHSRSAGSLFGPRRITVAHFLVGTGVCLGFYALSALVPSDLTPSENLDIGLWLSFLPMALLGVFIQTGAEEVLFRGYIQQQLAARSASLWVWMILPSALFAVLHYQPDIMGENAWIVVLAVFVFAICAADLTAKTGSIGAAWGFHFANNTVAILFITSEGPLSGLALYTLPADTISAAANRPLLFLDMGLTIATWAIIRFAVTRGAAAAKLKN